MFQSIVPHRTESYNCVPTPIEHSFPFCVIKSFPQIQEHAIVWAFNKIESLFQTKPVTFNEFWNSNGASLDELVEGESNGNLHLYDHEDNQKTFSFHTRSNAPREFANQEDSRRLAIFHME